MPRPRKSVPTYLHHKPKNLAYVRLPDGKGGRHIVYLGRYGSPESKAEYQRVLAELQRSPDPVELPARVGTVTVNEVLLAFMRFAAQHYRHPDGSPTGEITNYRRSLIPLRALYGPTPAAEFGPRALATVRQQMVNDGLCRSVVNTRVDRIKRVFKWAAAQEVVPVAVYEGLRTLAGLRRGRSDARETEPIRPADPAAVVATLPHLSRHTRAMVELQRHTGMRPGEVCKLRFADVDTSADVWAFRPPHHKTSHHGRTRTVFIGPQARAVLVAFLVNDRPPPVGWEGVDLAGDRTGRLAMADAYQEAGRNRDAELLRDTARNVLRVAGCVVDPAAPVFSPRLAREELYVRLRRARKTKVQPSQACRRKSAPERAPGEEYRAHALAHAVRVAADKAGVGHWHPNQLRHLWATEVRRRFGLEGAGASLGHAKMSVTEVYAERDELLAARVAAELG